ncbi:hypothetical protein EST38_g3010 [Candolleomyces aberdarensis]|uniref:Uncharacterized protein n=1 Tax=Candolleomyces aberdarensis TaxID=2316362 RepID=A0A4Q2DUN1_9AGAR|nr:hypothetical protein EST38_g3010 [Candolleomyces aberdarensis]
MIQYFWHNTDPERLKRYFITLDVCGSFCHPLTFEIERCPRCLAVNKVHYYIIVFSQVIVAAVLILRAYALYGKSRRVLALTCVIALVAASLAIWSVATAPTPVYTPNHLLFKGTCMLPTYLPTVERYMSSIIVAMILELVIFALIVWLFYFAVVMLAHFGVVLSYYLPKDAWRGNFATLANW